MANTSILAAFERMWQHVTAALGSKSDFNHNHNDIYYTETEIDSKLAAKSDSTHNHDSKYDAKGAANTALESAKTYADTAATKVKNDLLNGAGAAYDTLKELGDLIDDNQDAIDVLEQVAAGKADAKHSHAIADVSGLQSALTTAQNRADNAYTLAESKVDSLSDLGVTATATELNYVDGVTSNVQTQLDAKAPAAGVAYIDENDNETVTLSVDLEVLSSLVGGDV